MLPPGHIAAGYLVADALIKVTNPDVTATQVNQLLWWGAFFGFAPDLDTFLWFAKAKSFVLKNKAGDNHRRFATHAPILWMIPGVILYLATQDPFLKTLGLIWWFSSWSHFLLDTVQSGIMWLWPWKRDVYAIKDKGQVLESDKDTFFGYWLGFVKLYTKQVSFYLELFIIALALINILT